MGLEFCQSQAPNSKYGCKLIKLQGVLNGGGANFTRRHIRNLLADLRTCGCGNDPLEGDRIVVVDDYPEYLTSDPRFRETDPYLAKNSRQQGKVVDCLEIMGGNVQILQYLGETLGQFSEKVHELIHVTPKPVVTFIDEELRRHDQANGVHGRDVIAQCNEWDSDCSPFVIFSSNPKLADRIRSIGSAVEVYKELLHPFKTVHRMAQVIMSLKKKGKIQ